MVSDVGAVTEIIRYELPDDVVTEFLEAYLRALEHLLADRHCLAVEILRGVESPNRVIIRILWDSIDGHEAHFTNGPHFQPFIGHLRPYLQHVVEMEHYTTFVKRHSNRGQSTFGYS